jgi:hypothetical protein
MINKATLLKIVDQVDRGERLLSGEVQLLRDAVELLDDLATALDKIMPGSDRDLGFDHETTQELKIVDQGGARS